MPLTKQQLLIPRVLCIGTNPETPNYPGSVHKSGEILYPDTDDLGRISFWVNGKRLKPDDFLDFPLSFRKLEWWELRKVDDLPAYVKQTGMEDGEGNPVQDVVMKVKKHHSAGNGEWRDDSINIFCADSYLTGTPRSFTYSGWEPADESEYQEYQKQKEGLGMCKEKCCERVATRDYNGHGHYVCEQHYESLSNYFDEEYK